MLEQRLDPARSILYLRPTGPLQKEDFARLAGIVDPHIEANGALAGIVLDVEAFPGWENLGAMDRHRHRRQIGMLGEKLAAHFVAATIKHFPAGQVQAAQKWITAPADRG